MHAQTRIHTATRTSAVIGMVDSNRKSVILELFPQESSLPFNDLRTMAGSQLPVPEFRINFKLQPLASFE